MKICIKRAYKQANSEDGIRILVDRYWPRGIKKEILKIDVWMRELAPSNELRKWFAHDPEKFPQFKEKYKKELQEEKQQEKLEELNSIIKNNPQVTLVFGAKNERHNQAVVLKELLQNEERN